jgi:hypothetical protein
MDCAKLPRRSVRTTNAVRRQPRKCTMKIQYLSDTDTVSVLLNDKPISETRDLDENTLIDVDAKKLQPVRPRK